VGVREDALDDRTLVRGILKKDPAAERYFFDTYRPRLYRLATYILGYRDPDTEDAVQESLMDAHTHVAEFKFESSLYHWLYRICVFRCHTRIRNRRRQVSSLTGDLDLVSRRLSIDREGEREREDGKQFLLGVLREQMKRLDSKCRKLLDLRENQGLSYARLTKALRVPMGTVMSRLARCKGTLKDLMLKAMRSKGLDNG
jgi:RNA polymerase sigma-70 factor (ECF subfamily)